MDGGSIGLLLINGVNGVCRVVELSRMFELPVVELTGADCILMAQLPAYRTREKVGFFCVCSIYFYSEVFLLLVELRI